MKRLPIILIVAGVSAAVFSQLGTTEWSATIFGANDRDTGPLGLGPEWVQRVPDVAGGLGLSAALCGVFALRGAEPLLAAVVACVLALGTAFVIWWLIAPPASLFTNDGEAFGFGWSVWLAAAALVVATLAAAGLATRRDATPAARQRR